MSGWNPHQQKIVDQILGDCNWLVQNQQLLDYFSARPYYMPPRWPRPKSKWKNDCTGTIKGVVCNWNHVPTFDQQPIGFGDTQSFADSLHTYRVSDLSKAQELDVCLYNHGGPFVGGPHEHAVLLHHKHNNEWFAFSMGGDNDPSYVLASNVGSYGPPKMIIRFPIPLK